MSRGNRKVPQGDYAESGPLAVVDQGESNIAGYVGTLESAFRGPSPVIVFGDHTRRFKFVDFPFALGADGVKVLAANDGIDPRYLFHYLQTVDLPSAGYSRHFKFLKRQDIPVPPLEEQQRIVQVLDTAGALRAKRRGAIAKLDGLEESIFREAFGDPILNELGLPIVRLGDLGTWRSGGTPPRSRANYFDGDIPWFSSGELGPASLSESREQLTEQALTETSAKRVPRGAMMIGMYDTAALKASITVVNASCNQAVAFSKLEESVASATYVHRALCIGREYFRRQQRGVRQKNLNLDLVRDLRIPLPTIETQLDFVEQAAQVGRMRAVCETHLTHLNSLSASFQSRAFAGAL
jgi:type I restriction enzyme S subunit